MKIFTKAISVLILVIALIYGQQVNAQSILDPNDAVNTYSSSAAQGSATNPNQPAANTIGKWIKTTRMGWSTTQWKCYIYNGMPFRLIFPKSYTTAADGKKYPILVFWHGAGEAGAITDNEASLANGGQNPFTNVINNSTWDGFILVPQNQNGAWDPSQINYVKAILDYMVTNNKLDPFHIISNGLSAGGGACWESLQMYPQVFTGTPVFSANTQNNINSGNLSKTKFSPIWDFQGGLDSWPDPNDANIVNAAMVAAGAQYKYTLYPTLGHGTWTTGWAEPDFWPFCNRMYASNPWPLHGQTAFCPGVTVQDTLGVAPGFDAYQWAKNDTVISGATTNTLIVTTYAKYTCRVQRNGIWSDWSHTPAVISVRQATVTPTITVQGIASNVIPALDNTSVTLQLPTGYATYVWQKVGSNTTIGTTNTITVSTPGQYIAQVTETGGCSSSFGSPFTVVDANGANPPDAASGVLAASLTQTSVLLNWNQNPSPSYNETGFEIYQGAKSGGPYKLVAVTGADASKDTITGLTAGTKYFWVIRAVNGNGASATSNEASATTTADTQAPTAPGNLTITGTSYNGVSLQWTASTDNVGIAGYDIYVNGNKTYTVPATQTSFSVYSLTNGASYTFVVKARDQAGNVSTPSNQVSSEPLTSGLQYSYYNKLSQSLSNLPNFSTLTPYKTGTMTQFGLTPAEDDTYFGFVIYGYIFAPTTGAYSFQTTSDDGSRLYLGAAGTNTSPSPYSYSATPTINNDGLHSSSSVNSGSISLTAGQVYPIAVAYFNLTGGYNLTVSWKTPGSSSYVAIPASAFTQPTVTNGTVPNTPSGLTATAVDYKSIKLTWADNSNNETGFELYRATTQSFSDAAIVTTLAAGATSYLDNTCAASTHYYYEVRAINKYGASAFAYSGKEASWDFNNSLADSTGNSHTLTAVGSTTYDATNKAEGAASLSLNGTSQAMTISNTNSFLQEAYAQRAISVWIKPTNLTNANRVIFDAGGSTNGLCLMLNSSTLIGAVASGGTRQNITTTLSNTNWAHVALVYLGDTLQLYVNGTLVASNNDMGFHSIATTTDAARIGQTNGTNAYNTTGSNFSGNIDAVEVFNYALTAAEVTSVKNFTSVGSNATTQALPAVPAAPTSLVATATSSTGINLTWADNSTNETSFQVYRSNNNNSSYVLMATLPAGSTSFQDAGLFANATYYYKVDAVGVGGQSAYSNEVNATTQSILPVITQIGNQQARYGTTTVIAVSTTSGSAITLSASGLPAFATFTDNGNGTGKITLNPASSDAGDYTGLTVTATTGGGSASTTFNLAVNNNYAPTLDSIANYTMNEGDSLGIALHGANVNSADILSLSVSGLGSFYTLNQTNGAGTLSLKPGYAAAGSYTVAVTVNDNNGLSTTRTFTLTVVDKDPTTKIYARVQYQAVAPAPWNNMTGTTTSNMKDQNGNVTPVGVTFNPTSWWMPYNAGATTGNNSGVYPDVVMQEFYYFAFFDGPATASFTISGLDVNKKYDLTLFASSSLSGPSPDNGITSYSSGGQTVQLAVQGNTRNTVGLNLLSPDANGAITVNMAKITSYSPGYLNAFVIANHFDDSTAPAAPTTLAAALGARGVSLTWKDVAYNETNYKVYRSAGDSSNFAPLATLAAGSTSYTDTTTSGGIQYYYKVSATNTVGSSGYSNVTSIISANRIPTVTPIADVTMNNNQTKQVTVTATDDPTDHLTLTASNLPSFATFTDNGDGTGVINIVPPAGTQGIFPNVTITATDRSDSSRSTSFAINVVDSALNYIYVNVTTTTSKYQAPAPWNNLVAGYIPYAGTALANLKDQTGANSGATVTLTDGWSYVAETGMKRRNGSDVFPESVLAGSFYATDNSVHRITITGLNRNKAYNFLFFASHFISESTLTSFTANGQTISLDGSQNSNKTAQLNGITPDANGTVVINCQKASTAKFAMLSALVIESYTPGSATPIAPADLRVLDFRKTGTVPLQWQDRASNETGYEVWRAPHGGTYSLLKSLPANSTSYLDSALAPDVAYDYEVRATGASGSSAFSNPVKGYTYANSVYIFLNRVWAPPYNFPSAPAPFNNLNWIYQSLNTEWNNFKDENGQPTNIGMLQPTEWDEVDPFGATTGNNSGIYPDLAMGQGWLDFPGTSSYVTITGLDVSKHYDFTLFASCTDDPTANASGLYTINGQSGVLNAHQNTSGTLTFFGVTPDASGHVNIAVKTYDSSNSSFAILGNIAIKGYTATSTKRNTPPVASAGADQTITLPVNATVLNGSASQDNDGTIKSYHWAQISGPSTSTLSTPDSVITNVGSLVEGSYSFELTVTDDSLATSRDTVIVTVKTNQAPIAAAGNDTTITLPTSSTQLNGSGSSDPDGTIASYRWNEVSGPSIYTISDSTIPNPTISGLIKGAYVITLKVTDNLGATSTDTVIVTVSPALNVAPVANAGADQTIVLPTSSATLNGTGSMDSDGTIISYHWRQVSGPSTSAISSPDSATTSATNLVAGSYSFELAVTDDSLAVGKDTVVINVSTAAPAIKVNVYGGAYPASSDWNNWNVTSSLTSTAFKYSNGTTSTVTAVLSASTAISDNGANYPTTMCPTEVGRTTSYYWDPRTLTISGLDNNKTYNFELYSSRTSAFQNTFTINGVSIYINPTNNYATKASWTNITPSSGQIVVSLYGSYNYLNGFILTENTSGSSNTPPVASAGADQTITLPVNTTVLNGSASRDNDGTITSYHWAQISGPSTSILSTPDNATTNVGSLVEGSYSFELTVTDDSLATGKDTVVVIVKTNQAPIAAAGSDITITLPTSSTQLNGSGLSDPGGTIASYRWNEVSGPSIYTISDSTIPNPTISGLIKGTYVITLKVTDNLGATGTDTVIVTVSPAFNKAPVANAGADQTIVLPASSATLNGTGSMDSDGTIISYHWAQVSGPSTSTLSTPDNATTDVGNLVEGSYSFELAVTDDSLAVGKDTIVINVSTAAPAIKVNVYGGAYPAGTGWNNWNVTSSLTSTAFAYSDGTSSTITAVLSASTAISDNGANYPTTMCPTEVGRTASYYWDPRTLTISGLDNNKKYNFELYSSRTSAYQNTFTINGVSIYINPTNNYATKASWTNITPSNGQIVVSLYGSYNYLNGFTLTENTSGNSNSVNASTVAALASTLTSAQDSVELTAFPNPFRTEVQIQVNNVSAGKVWITVVDQSGRTLKQLSFTKGAGTAIQMIPVQELPSGTYFFQVQMAGWRKTIMAVKQQY